MILIRSRRQLLYLGPRRARSWRHGYGGRLGLPLESYRERNARAQVGGEKILIPNPCQECSSLLERVVEPKEIVLYG
jgi:hypothetical protein